MQFHSFFIYNLLFYQFEAFQLSYTLFCIKKSKQSQKINEILDM